VPCDLAAAGGSVDDALSATRELFAGFGRLLQSWPALVSAAKAHHDEYRRLLRPIESA
jgi:hypothetical protein